MNPYGMRGFRKPSVIYAYECRKRVENRDGQHFGKTPSQIAQYGDIFILQIVKPKP